MKLINLTQHTMTAEQVADLAEKGIDVIEVAPSENVVQNITFNVMPSMAEVQKRAFVVAEIAALNGANYAMVGGAGYLMGALESELQQRGITPLHAFTVREVVEVHKEGGEVVKTAVFRHQGFIGFA